ncbi:MAG: universal stress protein [Xanthomonadaceae bacterium]|nr:universal stress protein [Xanthomonadaceae bacterium]MDP2184056.1 universal stress protein [Xanthomonadales bacterium]MDZ4115703.1 universal stress protein [Xanthomonadaceae bacterium]MDZ4379154.1 universal stress protein [Xanthomonadaceae bacterium]
MNESPLIHTSGRVLAALDHSVYAASVADHAGWAATQLDAPLDMVHVIDRRGWSSGEPDLSGSLSLGGQEVLLEKLVSLDEQRGRIAQEQGRRLLAQAQARVAGLFGQSAAIKQRQGALVETLLELEPDVRLLVIGKRGEHANFAEGQLGSKLESVVRAASRPVLIAARGFRAINRFMIAFDGSATTLRCVEMVSASPLLAGLECVLLMVGPASVSQREALQRAEQSLREAGFVPVIKHVDGVAETVIAQTVVAERIDLLVMGAYGHSRIRNRIVGSTTTQVLRSCKIPVLLLR